MVWFLSHVLSLTSWHDGLFFTESKPGHVEFRDVVTPHSKFGFINDKFRCEICGHFGGMKMKCNHPGCRKKHENNIEDGLYFHPTCARQAGLQVADDGNTFGKLFRPLLYCCRVLLLKLIYFISSKMLPPRG